MAQRYNVTIWRMSGGSGFVDAVSVCVGELKDGKIVRSNASSCTGVDGTPAYHDQLVRSLSTFCGEPCSLYVTPTCEGYLAAIQSSIRDAFLARRTKVQRLTAEGVK
jgi:hypothetical protein